MKKKYYHFVWSLFQRLYRVHGRLWLQIERNLNAKPYRCIVNNAIKYRSLYLKEN